MTKTTKRNETTMSRIIHCFDVEVAKQYGVNEAIFIHHLQHWILKNRANQKHFHDGRTWTYNSVKAYSDLFPYLSTKQVRSAIESLIQKGVILKGKFNDHWSDHTNWYAFAHEELWIGKTICPPGQTEDTGKPFCPPGQISVAPQGNSEVPSRANHLTSKEQVKNKSNSRSRAAEPNPDHTRFIDTWSEVYSVQFGRRYRFNGGRDARAVKNLLTTTGKTADEIIDTATRAWSAKSWYCNKAITIHYLDAHWNEILGELEGPRQKERSAATPLELFSTPITKREVGGAELVAPPA